MILRGNLDELFDTSDRKNTRSQRDKALCKAGLTGLMTIGSGIAGYLCCKDIPNEPERFLMTTYYSMLALLSAGYAVHSSWNLIFGVHTRSNAEKVIANECRSSGSYIHSFFGRRRDSAAPINPIGEEKILNEITKYFPD